MPACRAAVIFWRRLITSRASKFRAKTKPGSCGRALHRRRSDALLHRGDFPELALERLVGLPGEVGIKLAELGRLRHKALIRALGVVGLHLDREPVRESQIGRAHV